jgi:hypothetical protein
MTPIADKREEGLKELASMIAAAHRRRNTGETTSASTAPERVRAGLNSEAKATPCSEPEDLRREGEFIEIVKVDNFTRKKAPQFRHSRNCMSSRS